MVMKYRLTRFFSTTSCSLIVNMNSHADAFDWGVQLMNTQSDATETTCTEFADGRLIVRVMNEEKLFAKIESI